MKNEVSETLRKYDLKYNDLLITANGSYADLTYNGLGDDTFSSEPLTRERNIGRNGHKNCTKKRW